MKNNKNVPFYSILFRLTHQGKMPNSEKKILKSMDHHFPLSDKRSGLMPIGQKVA
jgi:hypothetical protein